MISADAHMVAIDEGVIADTRQADAAASLFQAAALESSESEKGGPYRWAMSMDRWPGIAGSRQFGVFEIAYGAGRGLVKWTAFRAEKGPLR